MAISKITRLYVRRYRDSGQVTAYVEWVDGRGKWGRTEAPLKRVNHPRYGHLFTFGAHLHNLIRRTPFGDVRLTLETW